MLGLHHPRAPRLLLEVVYDGGGVLVTSWRCGAWWALIELGEA
ncbi:hypothetical protein WMF45_13660 [Sorangium sp. So ce448]